jgi:WD40 repeat protein
VAWSPNGTQVISGSDDKTLVMWDAATSRCLSFRGHEHRVLSVAWSPDGGRVVSGSLDTTLKVWDAVTGRCLHTLSGHTQSVRSVAWSPNGSQILSSGGDGTIRQWDAETGQLLRTWVIAEDEVALVDFPGNRILHATPDAWRLLGWQGYDPVAKRRRLLPAEAFGPLPPWPS